MQQIEITKALDSLLLETVRGINRARENCEDFNALEIPYIAEYHKLGFLDNSICLSLTKLP